MDLLGYFYIGMALIIVVELGLLFFVKKEKSTNINIISSTTITVLITLLVVSSMPSNFVVEKVIAVIIGSISVIGLVLRICCRKNVLLSKILETVALVGIFIYMLV